MCTVTFVPHGSGYYLGMNRDENRSRAPGLAPQQIIENGCRVTCPAEPGGGTWIAVNDRCISLALINWYSIPARVSGEARSRGEVIMALRTAQDRAAVQEGLGKLPLLRMNPFRLIGIFPSGRSAVEWWWDLKRLSSKTHKWMSQQWISSSFDQLRAQQVRGQTFQAAQRQKSAGSLGWLRRLHRCHTPEPGPFSTCMHRTDAVTVSYTEISVSADRVSMRYHDGAPCRQGPMPSHSLAFPPVIANMDRYEFSQSTSSGNRDLLLSSHSSPNLHRNGRVNPPTSRAAGGL